MNGKVKFFKSDKQFGFVTDDNDTDYFVHVSGFADENMVLRAGDDVTFDTEDTDRGVKAVNIKKAESSEE
ncbi:MAG: CspA family cold shock protein [Candidatus Woesearchaeota archaeon]|jgi:CspA family cold shock protein